MFKKNFIVMLLTAIMCLAMSTVAFAGETPVIVVGGNGSAAIAPDKAVITLGVTTTSKTAQLAQAENAQTANQVMAALNGLGIYSKDIQTQYNLRPVFEQNNYNKIIGYRADNTMTVTVNNIDMTGKVIDAALTSGAAKVNGISYGLKDETVATSAALQAAVADARHKADIIARALGVEIVGVQHVSENSSSMQRYELNSPRLMAMSADSAEASTPVSAGTIDVTAEVTIEYQIR